MKTLYEARRGEYVEKKSRFIATLCYVASEEEAAAFINRVKKEFYDARHNCFAYIIKQEDGSICKKSSDDGEPQGTAGHPMLDVLEGEQLANVAAVVTRYFGGTLLGTGGLVRSYTRAVKEALENSVVIQRAQGMKVLLTAEYALVGKLEYLIAAWELPVLQKDYGEQVTFALLVPEAQMGRFEKEIASLTNGKLLPQKQGFMEYAIYDGQVLTGEQLIKKEE